MRQDRRARRDGRGVKAGFPQGEIAHAALALQQEIDSGRQVVVGVNASSESDEKGTPILRIDPALERKQIDRLNAVRGRRDGAAVETAVSRIGERAGSERENLMHHLLEAARVRASEGEIVQALQSVWGDYRETPVF
jgi:methylmalonyl-CoA mutase, N-terminal domain